LGGRELAGTIGIMNIIIAGAGTVGTHAAEVLAAAGHNVTVIDAETNRLAEIEDTLDVRTLEGDCTYAEVLRRAGADRTDMFIAATQSDQINLLSAAVAKGLGARKTVARVRHSAYFEERGIDYGDVLGIDQFICPEYSTALEIASSLRNPGALAIENFAQGAIEMQEIAVGDDAAAIGQSLTDLHMPTGTRLAVITRNGSAIIPEARTVIQAADKVILAGNRAAFPKARALFTHADTKRRSVVIMGGSPMAVWLCRALKSRNFAIRLFEIDRDRAEELAEKLDWVTVVNADPTEPAVFDEEHLSEADAFVSLRTNDDEHNILAGAWAKSMGVKIAIAAVQRTNYLHLMKRVGIDRPFSPRQVAIREIENLLADRRLHRLASLAEGGVEVYQVTVGRKAPVAGKMLREVKLAPDWVIAAIQHADADANRKAPRSETPDVHVPGADDVIIAGDTVLVIGRHGQESRLKQLLAVD
jgi:trk/ktr system potassium uptake protein